ncbi:MAG: DUF2577 domain-containing protein [Lachnospiraceae bacterium]|nr:DUF2577 domain-containing protein [Lachnospiraceae bacterium]
MADTVELVKLLKKVAIEAMESKKLTNVVFGKVVSVNPLKINVEQKLPLTKAQLVLTRNVTNYKIDGLSISNALKKGDEVILIRQQGGQKYIVIDRIGEML